MSNTDDIIVFFGLTGLVSIGVYVFGYILGITFLMLSIFLMLLVAIFLLVCFFGFLGVLVENESENIKYEWNRAIVKNNGNIDGACMKFGDAEIRVEGPKNSFWKGMKYIFTGTEEYSTKLKVGGYEIGKVKFDSNGKFKLKWN